MEMIGPRLEVTTCCAGRRGIVNHRCPNAVIELEIQPDGSDWVTVFISDDGTPTGRVAVSLGEEEARRLHKVLGEALSERALAVAHGAADW